MLKIKLGSSFIFPSNWNALKKPFIHSTLYISSDIVKVGHVSVTIIKETK
jgi:hypothetical protein